MKVSRSTAARALLALESCVSVPIFVLTWMVCAIGFAAKAGFLMARADGEVKRTLLEKMLKGDA